MSRVSEIKELLEQKNEAIDIAIKAIETFMEPCVDGKTCEPHSEPPYHWRGCPTNLQPLITNLRTIRNFN